jgi:hypothetical protein
MEQIQDGLKAQPAEQLVHPKSKLVITEQSHHLARVIFTLLKALARSQRATLTLGKLLNMVHAAPPSAGLKVCKQGKSLVSETMVQLSAIPIVAEKNQAQQKPAQQIAVQHLWQKGTLVMPLWDPLSNGQILRQANPAAEIFLDH